MSGNLWMFSDKLDDEDIEIMKHEFITYYQGADYYGLGLKMFTRLAHEAGAVYKIGIKGLCQPSLMNTFGSSIVLSKRSRRLPPMEKKHPQGRERLYWTPIAVA